jgi:uncharacterized protein YbbC (DUF1343 family)
MKIALFALLTLTQTASAQVRPGVEVFLENPPKEVVGKRIGLITNHSGLDRQGRTTIDLLAASPHVKLVALFSPEHGIRGTAEARVTSGKDEKTGLPVHSLYGETYKPTTEMLEGVEALIYDIKDLGVRQYTYESTMALAMQTAAEKGIPIVILDRPNPVTGTIIEGNILEPPFQTFVGIYPVLSRHGLTMGELARMYNAEQKIGANLVVVPVQGWKREMWGDQTGLQWINPSPNIRRLEAAIHYPGTVFFEAINVSEGRGTNAPFEQIGAPWLKHTELVKVMNDMKLPGIRFEPITLTVEQGRRKFAGQQINGVRFEITDRNAYRPLATSLLMIEQIRKLHPTEFEWRGANQREPNMLTIERHGGTRELRAAIENGTVADLLKKWEADQAKFRALREKYLLYK